MLIHTPVMLKEVCEYLPQGAKCIVDCTLGHGGHTIALLSIAKEAKLIGLDIDEQMIHKAKLIMNTIDREHGTHITKRVEFILGNYANIIEILSGKKADYIVNDLGVNIEHFKDLNRGFSIRGNVVLDMRFDRSKGPTAADILATYTVDQLKDIFEQYADFSSSKALELAHHIVSTRKQKPIQTTQEFKNVLHCCGLGDPASVVIFQALRIETNKEMDNLKKFLASIPNCLQLSGRCAIITYHSIEDRLVKHAFTTLVNTGNYKLVTKKPLKPHYMEIVKNRSARSAKLRILEKIS